jgi:hypothetical protein
VDHVVWRAKMNISVPAPNPNGHLKALTFLVLQDFRLVSLAFSILVGNFLWNDETKGMNMSKGWWEYNIKMDLSDAVEM